MGVAITKIREEQGKEEQVIRYVRIKTKTNVYCFGGVLDYSKNSV
jgi:hypothetical protein